MIIELTIPKIIVTYCKRKSKIEHEQLRETSELFVCVHAFYQQELFCIHCFTDCIHAA